MNTEHPRYPGHYFVPADEEGLVELTLEERQLLLADEGVYMVLMANMSNQGERTDVYCACENARIPTHRSLDAPKPKTCSERLNDRLQALTQVYPEKMERLDCFVEGRKVDHEWLTKTIREAQTPPDFSVTFFDMPSATPGSLNEQVKAILDKHKES